MNLIVSQWYDLSILTYIHIFFSVRVNLSVNVNDLWHTFKPILSSVFVWDFLSLRHFCNSFWSVSKNKCYCWTHWPLAILQKSDDFLCNRSMKTGQPKTVIYYEPGLASFLGLFHQRQTVKKRESSIWPVEILWKYTFLFGRCTRSCKFHISTARERVLRW